MKIFAAGPLIDTVDGASVTELLDKLRDNGHEVTRLQEPADTPEKIGELLRHVAVTQDGVYMLPLWRSCPVARAIQATMRACGKTVGGFE